MISTRNGVMVAVWLLAALCASVWAEFDSKLDNHWKIWKKAHQKKYKNELEELGRRAVWENKLSQINMHNLEESLDLHSYTLGINQLSDLTEGEILQIVAPLKLPENFTLTPTPLEETNMPLPASVDWRKSGYVTKVKNQGLSCKSSWAFSVVGSVEGMWAKTRSKLVDISAQNLVDCVGDFNGCDGLEMRYGFEYIIHNYGIDSEAYYPYRHSYGHCRYDSGQSVATCSSYRYVSSGEQALKQAVATIGPISVLIDASDLSDYKSGVYNNIHCGKDLNHAMLIVGYGTDEATGLDYWLIKNSWGAGWGEKGYIRLARNKGLCGISEVSVYPLF